MKEPPPAQPEVPVIEMHEVKVSTMRDPEVVVVEGVNWRVEPQEYWVVAGLQGSGKTDFLMMTGGLMAPAGGEYRLFGERMPIFEEGRLKERLRLGLVFESGQLFNHLTVRENVALPLRYHRNLPLAAAAPEVQRVLEALELGPWADSTPGALGRNWQRRVGLARALILKPEVLLVDSPMAGLDLRHGRWWMDFLEELHRGHALLEGRPLTLVVTTADLRPWKERGCRFAIIREGRLSVLGAWAQLEGERGELVRELLMTEGRG